MLEEADESALWLEMLLDTTSHASDIREPRHGDWNQRQGSINTLR